MKLIQKIILISLPLLLFGALADAQEIDDFAATQSAAVDPLRLEGDGDTTAQDINDEIGDIPEIQAPAYNEHTQATPEPESYTPFQEVKKKKKSLKHKVSKAKATKKKKTARLAKRAKSKKSRFR